MASFVRCSYANLDANTIIEGTTTEDNTAEDAAENAAEDTAAADNSV